LSSFSLLCSLLQAPQAPQPAPQRTPRRSLSDIVEHLVVYQRFRRDLAHYASANLRRWEQEDLVAANSAPQN
jgi:hypothetical protein